MSEWLKGESAVNPWLKPTQVRILLPPLPADEPENSADVAQLVEHLHGKEGVGVGVPSSALLEAPVHAGVFAFRSPRPRPPWTAPGRRRCGAGRAPPRHDIGPETTLADGGRGNSLSLRGRSPRPPRRGDGQSRTCVRTARIRSPVVQTTALKLPARRNAGQTSRCRRCCGQGSIRLSVPDFELLTQIEPAPARMLAGSLPTGIASATSPVLASIFVTVPGPVFATQMNPAA